MKKFFKRIYWYWVFNFCLPGLDDFDKHATLAEMDYQCLKVDRNRWRLGCWVAWIALLCLYFFIWKNK